MVNNSDKQNPGKAAMSAHGTIPEYFGPVDTTHVYVLTITDIPADLTHRYLYPNEPLVFVTRTKKEALSILADHLCSEHELIWVIQDALVMCAEADRDHEEYERLVDESGGDTHVTLQRSIMEDEAELADLIRVYLKHKPLARDEEVRVEFRLEHRHVL